VSLLSENFWKTSYTSDDLDLVGGFYVPALRCAVRYDRATGYFSARALTLAARGVEGLLRNGGAMRLVVGCTLSEPEVEAIERGESLRDTIEARFLQMPIVAGSAAEEDALELVSWMVATHALEVKIAVPCDFKRKPCVADGIFHDKAGIIEDKTGDRLAFNGSVNETVKGWQGNWERLTVFTDFGAGNDYVHDLEHDFQKLWSNELKRALVITVPEAIEKRLLEFLPDNDERPKRLRGAERNGEEGGARTERADSDGEETTLEPRPPVEDDLIDLSDARRLVWGLVRHTPSRAGGGERVGEATSVIDPWPHQVRAFQRMYDRWPPKLLIADEVGLGKTIEAGMVLRQAWLSGRAQRILVLAPKAVLTQWQIELREKFNLDWPIYTGRKLTWYASPPRRGRVEEDIERTKWHELPFVLTSSQLMRRRDRTGELLEDARPWDLIVLDEAHHARRKGAGGATERGPNQLLRLMRGLRECTQGLLLLTATPMQVHPVEVFDLLDLLGLPEEWTEAAFLDFFEKVTAGNPSHAVLERLAALFRAVESESGETSVEQAQRFVDGGSPLKTRKILAALRDRAASPRRKLDADRRRAAIRIMKANTPVARLISRHTRELLRRYFQAGKISTSIANRKVFDEFVTMSTAERDLYEAVENYISSTYNAAAAGERNAVGFVMTIYRRRLASSFAALTRTLRQRLETVEDHGDSGVGNNNISYRTAPRIVEEDLLDYLDDDVADDMMDTDDAERMDRQTREAEERSDLEHLLGEVRDLPTDSKTEVLVAWLRRLQSEGFRQVMVFTQYTDTLDFLKVHLRDREGFEVLCFSGRGGERANPDGSWQRVSRDEIKKIFREGNAEVFLCTDAAAEGLNFQFCGALVNYDMPWNPMRVEQRIGRIDRLGQQYSKIQIVNLHYDDTVETDVYQVLHERIGLFRNFVGKLQPILATLPRVIGEAVMVGRADRDRQRAQLISDLNEQVESAESGGFDLDEIAQADLETPTRPAAPYNLDDLDVLINRPELLAPGVEVEPLGRREYKLSAPGMREPLRVTTDPELFDQHPESVELWSPGSPLFIEPDEVATPEQVAGLKDLGSVLHQLQPAVRNHTKHD